MGSRQIVLVSTAGFSVLNTGIFWREAKTKRLFSQCTKPLQSYGSLDRQASTRDTVLVKSREMIGRSQTHPRWLGVGEGLRRQKIKYICPVDPGPCNLLPSLQPSPWDGFFCHFTWLGKSISMLEFRYTLGFTFHADSLISAYRNTDACWTPLVRRSTLVLVKHCHHLPNA